MSNYKDTHFKIYFLIYYYFLLVNIPMESIKFICDSHDLGESSYFLGESS